MSIRFPASRGSARRVTPTVAAGLAVLATVAACATPADSAVPPAAGETTTLASPAPGTALATLLDDAVAAGVPGVVVRVDDGVGEPIELARQADWTTADHRLTARDQFRMGSNTKTMIGVLVLQLVAEERLSLEDPVEEWLPGAVPNGHEITLRMLLNHTSGLADYIYAPEVMALITGQSTTPLPPARLLEMGTTLPALSPPGTSHAYSNTNYVALGMVLEDVSGETMETLFQQRILEPLELPDTYLAVDGESRDGDLLADGYEPDAEHLAPLLPPGTPEGVAFAGEARDNHVTVTSIDPSWSWAAGAVVSTPQDWQRFLRALMSGEVLPPAQLAEMKDTVVELPDDPASARYGLGLEQYQSPCGPVWGHTGGIPGYSSANYVDETGTRSVTVVTTTQFGLFEPELGTAEQGVIDGAVCTMLGETSPVAAN
ncbi:D-alanyl-D-alanine carboxypeptidase [Actinoalloteichus hoggarensis]|uniref:D-alanyl-D-alanine carboxypeptidase n=1 Tax=Actinoalloteichus hoggarensis TaxID=1470176 RepID=A0A221W418_9PSEU|nr:serine hydrolase domain-containing protein [Actinoalloteichus hoggarensis]ASO20565.1 D-alanyl-D-alanine carboxypeptidase precursor [Actinoalloteichus hoggarensis]MBB5923605.1 D-alanyl-D-alanine carboxypeptidase [Actinoalloteichus hoggarensis]